ncbi:hypothetical protein P7K49_029826 [Saguinus oedipus]|uniref:Uncharacterized protein n=1 Tax=Saguinus oedipus TaxID=9490 RepID=A0ABQ9U8A9_SAGOE|nr:hypothetical protein P7K49_029826 [Saguinus oedipus]
MAMPPPPARGLRTPRPVAFFRRPCLFPLALALRGTGGGVNPQPARSERSRPQAPELLSGRPRAAEKKELAPGLTASAHRGRQPCSRSAGPSVRLFGAGAIHPRPLPKLRTHGKSRKARPALGGASRLPAAETWTYIRLPRASAEPLPPSRLSASPRTGGLRSCWIFQATFS